MPYGVSRHFQQYFNYIVAICFIGGGNRSARRKPPTAARQTLSHNFVLSTPCLGEIRTRNVSGDRH
jgi:hypothetical protein